MRGLRVFGMPRFLGQNRWFLDHVLKPKNPKKGSHTACLKAAARVKGEGGVKHEVYVIYVCKFVAFCGCFWTKT